MLMGRHLYVESGPESAILVIRNESCDVHYFLYVYLSFMLPNKFLSSNKTSFNQGSHTRFEPLSARFRLDYPLHA